MSYFQQKSSFLSGNSSEQRREASNYDGKSNQSVSIFGNNVSQFSGSTVERSYLNMNVRDSLVADGNVGSTFDVTDRKQNKLQDFFNLNQKYSSMQPQSTSIFNGNANSNISSNPFAQTAQFGSKQQQQQSFLNFESSNNHNLTPNKLSSMQQQSYQQASYFDNEYDSIVGDTDYAFYSSNIPIHSNGLGSYGTHTYQYQKFKQEINGLLTGDSRQPSSRDNGVDYFSNNLTSKRTNFRSSDGFYDPPATQQSGVYSQGNTTKAVDSIFGSGLGNKNQQKFSNFVGNNSQQRSLFENHSVIYDHPEDNDHFRRDGQKKNSRSTSFLGDTSFTFQTQQQQDLNSSYVYSNSVQNTVRSSQTNANSTLQQALRNRSQNQNYSESKQNTIFKENTQNDGGYKVGNDFAQKLRLQKCESSGEFQMKQQQQNHQNYQTVSNNSSNNQQTSYKGNGSSKANTSEDLYAKDSNKPRQTHKQQQSSSSKMQTEESFRYSPSQETKSNYSTHNFDSITTQEKTPYANHKEELQTKKSQINEFSKQWEELNSFKKNQEEEKQKSEELTQKLLQSNSTGKIDFKSIKLSRTPLQTIDIKQQLANIDQKAKLEAYGETMQPPEVTKIDQIVPQILPKSPNSLSSTLKAQSSSEEQQKSVTKEQEQPIKESKTKEKKGNEEDKQQNNNNKNKDTIKNKEKQNNETAIQVEKKENAKAKEKNEQPSEQQKSTQKVSAPKKESQNKQEETVKPQSQDKNLNEGEQLQQQNNQQNGNVKSQSRKQSGESQNKQAESKQQVQKQDEQKPKDTQKKDIPQIEKEDTVKRSKQQQKEPQNGQTQEQNKEFNETPLEKSKQSTTIQEKKETPQSDSTPTNNQIKKDIPKQNDESATPQTKTQNKDQNKSNSATQNKVDIQGIVQNIRSVKQDLKQKRNSRVNQEDNVSKNSAAVLQTDSASTPSFQLGSNQLSEFPQVTAQKENGSHIENLKYEIFSDFGKKGKDHEQEAQQVHEQEIQRNEKPQQVENQIITQKNKNKFQMEVIEEEIRTKNASIEYSEQINTRSSGMSFQQQQDFNSVEQIEQEKQHELSFNGANSNQLMPTSNSSNNIHLETDHGEDEVHNQVLQQELSIDLILRYQQLLNNSSNASVKNLPLEYTKEMVNLAYCILQTVRNCSSIPQDQEQADQEGQEEEQF